VHALTRDAVAHARAGEGPVFLELKTYRWREHCGPGWDNHIGYRTEAEYLEWRKRDPIENFENKLRGQGALDEGRYADFRRRTEAEIASAFDAAKRAPFPAGEGLMNYLYA
jgi:pyruvate dehydrogenase E1 component alpha subunit